MRFITTIILLITPFLSYGQNKKDKKRYSQYIVSADSSYNVKNYKLAKEKYTLASAIKPKEQYPITRIDLCNKMLIAQGVEYKKYILLADSCLLKEDWVNAKMYYIKASAAKPQDQYSSDQIKNCHYHILSAVAIDDLYEEQLRRGDSCFVARSWSCAKANYEAASRTKPEEQYPKDKVFQCKEKIAPVVSEERYQLIIGDADAQYAGGNYLRAKQLYEE